MIHENHKNMSVSYNKCPLCGDRGMWRSGVHFDNQKICMNHEAHDDKNSYIWCPDEVIEYLREYPIGFADGI